MEFKIDTKENFSVIMPVTDDLNAKLTEALGEKINELRQSGSNNFIVDLNQCTKADKASVKEMVTLHEDCYSMDQSFVITGVSPAVMNMMKEDEADLLLNIAPRMAEAIDIVSMEILERDLFNEE
ncbi:MAG: STAS domain-containing protein [Bacteroidota bacterium]